MMMDYSYFEICLLTITLTHLIYSIIFNIKLLGVIRQIYSSFNEKSKPIVNLAKTGDALTHMFGNLFSGISSNVANNEDDEVDFSKQQQKPEIKNALSSSSSQKILSLGLKNVNYDLLKPFLQSPSQSHQQHQPSKQQQQQPYYYNDETTPKTNESSDGTEEKTATTSATQTKNPLSNLDEYVVNRVNNILDNQVDLGTITRDILQTISNTNKTTPRTNKRILKKIIN